MLPLPTFSKTLHALVDLQVALRKEAPFALTESAFHNPVSFKAEIHEGTDQWSE